MPGDPGRSGTLERDATRLLGDQPDFQRYRAVPGVGPIVALTILAEAGDLRRFGHHRQCLKFCGLDLATQQSGAQRSQTKLSKHGNRRLRSALWMAAGVAIRLRENSFRQKYFARALFTVRFGPKPGDENLKRGMLGK